jgi:hypothetical protein
MAEKKPKAKRTAAKPKARSAPARKAVAKRAAPRQAAARAPVAPKKRKAAPRRASGSASSGFDITKLIDHPLVTDLLAVGAIAAVAAIADHNVKTRTGEGKKGSGQALKAAGKAAADAIGRRLSAELDEIRKASKNAPRRGSK